MRPQSIPIVLSEKDIERFWSHVDQSGGPDACHPWTKDRVGGYGRFYLNGKYVKTHRIVVTLANGPIPEGLEACHSCDNPPCCNRAHLWLGTTADNAADRNAKGRTPTFYGERNVTSKLTSELVDEIRYLYQDWTVSQRQLARAYEISRRTLREILKGELWTHYG